MELGKTTDGWYTGKLGFKSGIIPWTVVGLEWYPGACVGFGWNELRIDGNVGR